MLPHEHLLQTCHEYQAAVILGTAAELDFFSIILDLDGSAAAQEVAKAADADLRGTEMLLDALCSLRFLRKVGGVYSIPEEYVSLLDPNSPESQIPFLLHSMSCLRRWSQLSFTIKNGKPAPSPPSIRGSEFDHESFVQAMNSLAVHRIPPLMANLRAAGLLNFRRMLDLGGATGSYTCAFLKELPEAEAVIFDLPKVKPLAEKRIAEQNLTERVSFCAGNFYEDPIPAGFDFVWISAIIHQQDSAATLKMFRQSFDALQSGGKIAVRDVFFDSPECISPLKAGLFSINMLSATKAGKVYSLRETFQLLLEAGFENPQLAVSAKDMSAVVSAEKR